MNIQISFQKCGLTKTSFTAVLEHKPSNTKGLITQLEGGTPHTSQKPKHLTGFGFECSSQGLRAAGSEYVAIRVRH